MSEEESGAATDNAGQGDSNGAAPGTERPKHSPLPASVTARFSELSQARRRAEAEKADEVRRREAAEARIAELQAQIAGGGAAPTPTPGPRATTREELDRMADELADKKLSQKELQRAVVRIDGAGRKLYADFDEQMGQFAVLGGIAPVFPAIAEMDNAPDVLYALSQDLDKAAEILALGPVAQGRALAKLEMEVAARKVATGGLSRTPAPLEPIGGRSPGIEKDPDTMDNDEWFSMREKQIAESRRRT